MLTASPGFAWDLFKTDELPGVDEAFQVLPPAWGPDGVAFRIIIAPGTYLYKDKTYVELFVGNATVTAQIEGGVKIHDGVMGDAVIFTPGTLDFVVPVDRIKRAVALPGSIHYQGCSTAGICYPPQKRTFTIPAGVK